MSVRDCSYWESVLVYKWPFDPANLTLIKNLFPLITWTFHTKTVAPSLSVILQQQKQQLCSLWLPEHHSYKTYSTCSFFSRVYRPHKCTNILTSITEQFSLILPQHIVMFQNLDSGRFLAVCSYKLIFSPSPEHKGGHTSCFIEPPHSHPLSKKLLLNVFSPWGYEYYWSVCLLQLSLIYLPLSSRFLIIFPWNVRID